MNNFEESLKKNLKTSQSNNYKDNYDFRRFGIKKFSIKKAIKGLRHRLFIYLGIYSLGEGQQVWENIEKIEWLYNLLDEESKNLLIQLISYRILGGRYIKLPINTPEYWEKLEKLDSLSNKREKINTDFKGWTLEKINLENEGYPIEMFITPDSVYTQMILEQYQCQSKDSLIRVEKGDIAIDAGACYGDTAMNFAHNVGTTGHVYSWEFMPDNLKIFKKNLKLNPHLADQIDIVENPMWSTSGEKLYVSGTGPASQVGPVPPKEIDTATTVQTYSIDDLYTDKKLKHVHFIKMDIEGAELEALKGAINTIKECKPKLAISVYHYLHDFWEISQWIDSLELGYKFHLRHFTIHAEETVLFASVE